MRETEINDIFVDDKWESCPLLCHDPLTKLPIGESHRCSDYIVQNLDCS